MGIDTGKIEVLHEGKPIKGYDCIYPKGSYKYHTLLESLTASLHKECYIPFSPHSFVLGHDKLLTQIKLQKNNVPMPKAYISSTDEEAKNILEDINYPIIMKFPHGTQGKGVMYAESFAVASSLLDALSTLKQPFLIQEYVETGSTDIRAIVVGEKVVASMKRKADGREKRANFHMGGTGEPVTLDTKTKNLAIKAAKVLGADICAVDMLEGVKSPLVIEVNLSPGLQLITKTTEIDVADKMAHYLFEKAKKAGRGTAEKRHPENNGNA